MCGPLRIKAVAALLLIPLAGCVSFGDGGRTSGGPPQLSSLQRAAMQTREVSGDFETVFAATLSVLQDEGWQIDTVDRDSGLIQASSVHRHDVIGPSDDWRADSRRISKLREKTSAFRGSRDASALRWTRWAGLTVHAEPWGGETTRLRITVVRHGELPSGVYYVPEPKTLGFRDKQVRINARQESMVVDDPRAYQQLFQQIQRAVFVRQGLNRR